MSNVFEPQWQPTKRSGCRVARVAADAGAQRLGASVVEIGPGALSSPYHVHHGNEELLIVLSGAPELRTPHGLRTLAPGDIVSFPRGGEGAHRLRNTSREPCRVLFVSEMHLPEVVEYPDTGATLTVTAPAARLAFPAGTDQSFSEIVGGGQRVSLSAMSPSNAPT